MTDADLAAPIAFATSLGIGLLMGLERERHLDRNAGLRTFGLVAVLGTGCGLLTATAQTALLIPATLLALAVVMIGADRQRSAVSRSLPDVTTTVALLLCFVYGAMLWYGQSLLTVTLALTTVALLHFKAELHWVSSRLGRKDLLAILQFVLISTIVLPLLPDTGYGPYAALNPYRLWLMVVLVAGISLTAYLSLRLAVAHSPLLLGVLGGMISSTATTLAFARRARQGGEPSVQAAVVVLLAANLVLLLRIAVVTAVIAPSALPSLGLVLLAGLLGGGPALWRQWRASASAQTTTLDMQNPMAMLSALGFAAVFAVALVLTAWLNERAGSLGIYALAPVLGLTDMDAITLSALKLYASEQLSALQLTTTLMLALGANLCFKAGIARGFGGAALGRKVAMGFLPVFASLLTGVLLLRVFS